MKTTRGLLDYVSKSMSVIIAAEPELTTKDIEEALRKVQMFWNSERPLLLSNQN